MATRTRSRRGRLPAPPVPKPRKLPRNERAVAAYEAMVVAAERVLATQGIGALTTNRIAEVAGVSIGSLYQYFPNKEAIAAALIDRYVTRFIGTAAQLIAANAGAEPATIVTAIGAAISGLFRASQPIHRHLRELRAVAGKSDSLDGALDRLVEAVAGYLRSRPELRVDPASAAFTIVHAVDGAINAFAIRPPMAAPLDDPDTMARELAHMVGAYLGIS